MSAPSPPGYHLARRERIPLERLSWISLAAAPLWLALFVALARALGARFRVRPRFGPRRIVRALTLLSVIMPLAHEAVHGIVARALGARPRFGLGAGFAYTTFAEPVSRDAYLAIGLAPLLALSGTGLALLVAWPRRAGQLLIFLVGNAAGSTGDLWVLAQVAALPADALIRDLADGFAVYLPDDGA
ncbi:MAG TPA: DUF3267 domain-containing protein [Thermomicrobiaceae bacterium]|nr:DUF3267 domain-containing protein [Thermomicrobiaceae bacterium]